MHFHIHTILHLVRMAGSMRFLGMLPMLLFSLFQFASAEPATTMIAAKEKILFLTGLSCSENPASIRAGSGPSTDRGYGTERPDPSTSFATNKNPGVFHRLQPGIVLIPRMNRTPKPKSVYRCFARAPGGQDREA